MEFNYKTLSRLLFPEQPEAERTPSQKFDDMLRNQLYSM